ncbi:MAG: bifunctional riboflavin kinase/FAD synthetase [Ruminococcaceae bacterium]|nr:bifunctional riboflavin kinase/FAD synthetase [Oscillospiraceae bacterium]
MNKEKRIFALGFFDGVHLGHQALLRRCVDLARQHSLQPAAITFDRHPQSIFTQTPPPQINTAADRVLLLKRFGMEQVITLPVTREVMSTPWESFLDRLTEQGAAGFVCGQDFRFGHRGEGNAERLEIYCRQRNLPFEVLQDQTLDGIRISSTHIRSLVESGEMEAAVKFLGHPHILTGTVVTGQQLGRKIGIPTANLVINQGVLVPKFGVYACKILTETGEFMAVTNVGTRPTVAGNGITVEPWILDFNGDLYGKTVTLQFCKFLRSEKKFPTLADLQAEIRKNAEEVRNFFEKY